MKIFWNAFFVLTISQNVFAKVNDCVITETVDLKPLRNVSRVWLLDGKDLLYEYAAGISVSETFLPFNGSSETLVLIAKSSSNNYLLFTRTERGLALYKLTMGTFSFTSLGKFDLTYKYDPQNVTITSPLVDAIQVKDQIYLATNHHLLLSSVSDLAAGKFNPTTAAIAFLLFFIAHLLRLRNMRSLCQSAINPELKNIEWTPILRSFSVGFLFNALFPLKAGDLARALLLARDYKIGRGTTLFLVFLERIFDCLVLSLLSILFLICYKDALSTEQFKHLFYLPLALLGVGAVLMCLLLFIYNESAILLKVSHRFSAVFNDHVRDQLRYRVWSAIHGAHIIIRNSNFKKYLATSIGLWSLYILGTFALVTQGGPSFLTDILVSALSQVNTSIQSGGELTNQFRGSLGALTVDKLDFFSFTQQITFLQMSYVWVLGVIMLIIPQKETIQLTEDPRLNKVQRRTNMATEFSPFLEQYFAGGELFKEINLAELRGDMKLLKTLSGGSNAMTLLATDEKKKMFVRKVCNLKHREKLKAQYEWLTKMQSYSEFPKAIQERAESSLYYYDMSFDASGSPFFSFIHSHPVEKSKALLSSVLKFVQKSVHISDGQKINREKLFYYIEDKVVSKIRTSCLMDDRLLGLDQYEFIEMNGVKYKNIRRLLETLRSSGKILDDLCSEVSTDIHGDLTVDNIIATTTGFYLLDPNNENHISTPSIDFGKLFQSFNSGYEFLVQLKEAELVDNKIRFEDIKTLQYHSLNEFLKVQLKGTLSPEAYRSLLFHEAVHYCRMLPYRININAKTAPVFYGIATKLFSEFIDLYSEEKV